MRIFGLRPFCIMLIIALGIVTQPALGRTEIRLTPSDELNARFVLRSTTWLANPGTVCLGGKGDEAKSSFGFAGAPGPANDGLSIKPDGFSLHGQASSGSNGWKLPEGRRGVLVDAEPSFAFFATSVLGSGNATLGRVPYILAEADSEDVPCGAVSVRRWLLLRPTEDVDPFPSAAEEAEPLEKGGRYAVVEIVDRKGTVLTCVYGEGKAAVRRGERVGVNEEVSSGSQDSSREGLGAKEVAGIAAGISGCVIAIVVVIVAAILWRRQRENGTDPDENVTEAASETSLDVM